MNVPTIRFYLTIGMLIAASSYSQTVCAQGTPAPNTPRPVKFYYNSACELTTPEKAYFVRESSLDFENIVFSGICKDYLVINNKIMDEGYFDQGVNKGLHSDYFDNGKLESTIEYADDGFIIWELTDRSDNHTVSKGTGQFKLDIYSINAVDNQSATLNEGILNGQFLNGKRTGTWTYSDKQGVKTDEEIYDNGKFLRRTSYTAGSAPAAEDTKKPIIISLTGILTELFNFDKTSFTTLNDYFVKFAPPYEPSFRRWIAYPGGMKKLLLQIARGLRTDIPDNITIKITVDENGKFGKTKSSLLYGGDFASEIKSLIKPHELKFLPAVRDGKPYALSMKLPVGNSAEWIHYLETTTDEDLNGYLDQINAEP